MQADTHRFFCHACNKAIFGSTTMALAVNVNGHNDRTHPMDFADWTAGTIVHSSYYLGPSEPPDYLQRHTGTTLDTRPPVRATGITERDKIFLKINRIRWD